MKKFNALFAFVFILSMVLGACAPAAPATVVEAPVAEAPAATVAPTQAPEPTAVPAPDFAALLAPVMADLAGHGYGQVASAKLNEELAEGPIFLLDIREKEEIEKDGFIEGAVNIPVRDVLKNLDKLPAQDQKIVVYCASGHRGGILLPTLKLLGYTNVRNLQAGLGAWKKAELPTVTEGMAEAKAGTAPTVDAALLAALDGYISNLPQGFSNAKPDQLNEMLGASPAPFVLDVRKEEEIKKNGYVEGSLNVPFEVLWENLDKLPADKTAPLVVMCQSGVRSALVLSALNLSGYSQVTNLAGGFNAWKTAQMPFAGGADWNAVWTDFLANLPEDYLNVKAENLNAELAEKAPFLLDVREKKEIEENGYLQGAVNVPMREVFANLDKLPAQDQPIVVYCAGGYRSPMVVAGLKALGYANVRNLAGGFGGWAKAELPVVKDPMPEAAAGTAPQVNTALLESLNAVFAAIPDGYNAVKPADLNVELGDKAPFLLDLRTEKEFTADGIIEGAVNVPVQNLMAALDKLPADKAAPIVLICKSGHRGSLAMPMLLTLGYTNVRNLSGGMTAWAAAELPVAK